MDDRESETCRRISQAMESMANGPRELSDAEITEFVHLELGKCPIPPSLQERMKSCPSSQHAARQLAFAIGLTNGRPDLPSQSPVVNRILDESPVNVDMVVTSRSWSFEMRDRLRIVRDVTDMVLGYRSLRVASMKASRIEGTDRCRVEFQVEGPSDQLFLFAKAWPMNEQYIRSWSFNAAPVRSDSGQRLRIHATGPDRADAVVLLLHRISIRFGADMLWFNANSFESRQHRHRVRSGRWRESERMFSLEACIVVQSNDHLLLLKKGLEEWASELEKDQYGMDLSTMRIDIIERPVDQSLPDASNAGLPATC